MNWINVVTLILVSLALAINGYMLAKRVDWKARLRKVVYAVWFKAHQQDCVTCNGSGKRPISGGIVGSGAGPSLLWDCVWCEGTGKEKIAYTYRFGWVFKLVRRERTPAQFERDQNRAEDVLGPARERLLDAKGVTEGGDDDRGTDDG